MSAEHDPRWASRRRPRSARGRHVLLLGEHHRRLLPALLWVAAGESEERAVPQHKRLTPSGQDSVPCRRCKPDQPAPEMRQAAEDCRHIPRHRRPRAREAAASTALAAGARGLSPYHFHRVFKAVTGVTPAPMPPPTARNACTRSSRGARP